MIDSKRCYIFEDDLMRAKLLAGSATVEHHIVSSVVTRAIHIFRWLTTLGYDTIEAYEHCVSELLDSKRCYSVEYVFTRPKC